MDVLLVVTYIAVAWCLQKKRETVYVNITNVHYDMSFVTDEMNVQITHLRSYLQSYCVPLIHQILSEIRRIRNVILLSEVVGNE